MEPRASILIPVYNRERFIGACIDSALSQSISDIEVIVCDNQSSDNTWEVVQSYAARDSRLRVFQNEVNLGPVRNWARCVAESRSPISKILFSDDLMSNDFLEQTLPLIQNPEVAFVFSASEIGEEPGKGKIHYAFGTEPGIWEPGLFLVGHVFAYDLPSSPGAALFRTEDLRSLLFLGDSSPMSDGFLRTGAGPDVLLFLRSESLRGRAAHVPRPLVFFRSHPDSITIGQFDRVSPLYRRAIAKFVALHRPDLLRIYLSGIEWLLGPVKGRTEVHSILQDSDLAFKAPTRLQVCLDMRCRAWSRFLRQFRGSSPSMPFKQQ